MRKMSMRMTIAVVNVVGGGGGSGEIDTINVTQTNA